MYEQIYYLIGENRYFESLITELLEHDDRKFIENEKEELKSVGILIELPELKEFYGI
ncbi:hypothetical protein ACRCJZ_09525 [Aerococcus urinaeequi]|uniref:hypothetical protein n=1 Tax=Aerococcus urinaeequi TaxID=51665 RepID=UPI003D6B9A50